MKNKIAVSLFVLLLATLMCASVVYAEAMPYTSDSDVVYDDGFIYNNDENSADVSYSDESQYLFDYSDDAAFGDSVQSELDGKNFKARVLEILDDEVSTVGAQEYSIELRTQTLRVKLLSGPKKGQEAIVSYDLSDTWGGDNGSRPAKVGNMVIVQISEGADGVLSGYVTQFGRHPIITVVALLLVALIAFFGGKRGLRSLLALVVTCVGLIFVMVPLIVDGMDPVWAAVLSGVFSIAVTLIITYGFTIKTLAAGLGAGGGVIMAGIIAAIMSSAMHMTGLVDDESMYLAQSVGENGIINLRGILFAAIIISVLGGTIDVGISIASALDELRTNAKDITGAQMMQSGINIGIDIMGASLNTLILSYVGGSLHLLMIFCTYDSPMLMIINDEMIVSEILRALAGSFGLLLTVPITSFVSAMMMCKGNFGKFDPNCFASVVMFKRLAAKLKALGSGEKKSNKASAEEQPENLYELARSRNSAAKKQDNISDYYD